MTTSDTSIHEEWRPVPGFESTYSISSLGRVRRDSGGAGARPGLILKPQVTEYTTVRLRLPGVYRTLYVHRLVAEAFHGAPKTGAVTNHKNGDKNDNRPENVEWVSQSRNVKHAYAAGLSPARKGRDYVRTLTADDVRAIRASDEPSRVLAARFGVQRTTISHVRARKTWRHVE